VWQAADDALVAGMAAGDAEAARALVRRHQRRVVGLAATIVGDPDAAEDVAQEAFTRVWRHAANYDPLKASVLTWLLTITRNLAIDNARLRRAVVVDPDTLVGLDNEAVHRG
jgi:RNA polymerase sigma-70 factor (ECF subfamily)